MQSKERLGPDLRDTAHTTQCASQHQVRRMRSPKKSIKERIEDRKQEEARQQRRSRGAAAEAAAPTGLGLLPADVQQAFREAAAAEGLGDDEEALRLYNVAIPASVKYLKGAQLPRLCTVLGRRNCSTEDCESGTFAHDSLVRFSQDDPACFSPFLFSLQRTPSTCRRSSRHWRRRSSGQWR